MDEYYEGNAPVWIVADSGLISSQNNYVSETPVNNFGKLVSPCQYMFKEEAYKCIAPESKVCGLPACDASYNLYSARTDAVVTTIVNGGTVLSPPCDINVEVILPCFTSGKNVTLQLLNQNGTVISNRDEVIPFFLFGNMKSNVFAGKIAPGKYKIQAVANGAVHPSPIEFTLSGNCTK